MLLGFQERIILLWKLTDATVDDENIIEKITNHTRNVSGSLKCDEWILDDTCQFIGSITFSAEDFAFQENGQPDPDFLGMTENHTQFTYSEIDNSCWLVLKEIVPEYGYIDDSENAILFEMEEIDYLLIHTAVDALDENDVQRTAVQKDSLVRFGHEPQYYSFLMNCTFQL